MRTRPVGTATILACLAGAAVLTTALAAGPGAPLSHRVVAPGITGGQGVDALRSRHCPWRRTGGLRAATGPGIPAGGRVRHDV